MTDLEKQYDERYYATSCGPIPYARTEHWVNFFGLIADQIVRSLHPKKVLDAGCAIGLLVEALWERGVEAYGVDISSFAISNVRQDMKSYCRQASITDPIEGRFDLVTCIEVLEHLPPEETEKAIQNLCSVSDTILFSSSPSDFSEPTHINVRPTISWLNFFAEHSFWPDVRFDAGFATPHAILFRKMELPKDALLPLFADFLRYKTALLTQSAQMSSSIESLRGERDRMQASAEALSHELETLKTIRTDLEARTASLEYEYKLATSQLELSKALAADLTEQRAALDQRLKEAQAQIEEAHLQAAERLRGLEAQRSQGAQMAAELSEHREQRAALDQRLKEAQAQIEEAHLQAAAVQKGRLEALQIEKDRAEARMIELRERVAQVSAEKLELFRQLESREAYLAEILSSPAWKVIERYRRFLENFRSGNPRVFQVYEKGVAAILRRLGRTPAPPSSATPDPPAESSLPDAGASSSNFEMDPPAGQAKDPQYQKWILENEPGPQRLVYQREISGMMLKRPVFSIIIPVYKVSPDKLKACIDSVLDQTYPEWELCIAYADPDSPENLELLRSYAERDNRIRLKVLDKNLGISGNSNASLEMASGEFVAFLDHDDAFAPFALFKVAAAISSQPDIDLVYSDHDYIEETGSLRSNPLFKPDWSPEIMLSANYITHLTVIRRSVVNDAGNFDSATDGAQDWDLFLKVVERTQHIAHIPEILYHWRAHQESTALNPEAKAYAAKAQLLSINRHIKNRGLCAESEVGRDGLLHLRWKLDGKAKVSIIIPSKNKVSFLRRCVSTLVEKTEYPSWEIVVVDNGSTDPDTLAYYEEIAEDERIRVAPYPEAFNYSAANNIGAREARGEFLLFLNDDTSFTRPEWLTELVGLASISEIGIVGGRLLRENGSIQHAGIALGLTGYAGHPFADLPPLTFNLAGSTGWYRNYLAVTGASMMMRRTVYEDVGGFDEEFVLCGSDVAICLQAWKRGYRVAYNPFAELIHYESQTRGASDIPASDFETSFRHYRPLLESGDPFWNKNLSLWNSQAAFRYRGEQDALTFVNSFLAGLRTPAQELVPPVKTVSPAAAHRKDDPPQHYDQAGREESLLVTWFDCTPGDLDRLKAKHAAHKGNRPPATVMWLIPMFENPFYGGIHTILRFAQHWWREKGTRSVFAICGSGDSKMLTAEIQRIYTEVKRSDVYILPSIRDVEDLPPSDVAIATLWTTAYFAVRYSRASRYFYMVQDFEPGFYRAGAASALVENTLRFGAYAIANTVSLQHMYEREFGGIGTHFNPSVDLTVFNSSRRAEHSNGPWKVFCYARPQHPRNAFHILASAMRILKSKLGAKVNILSAGAEWNPKDFNLEGVIENLGVLPYHETANLYRQMDAGVALMLTRHPSYIPLELMASGSLVITNKNHWTEWLLRDKENCLLSDPSPSCLAETIENGLQDVALRKNVTRAAQNLIREKYSDWRPEMEHVYAFLCDPEGNRRPL